MQNDHLLDTQHVLVTMYKNFNFRKEFNQIGHSNSVIILFESCVTNRKQYLDYRRYQILCSITYTTRIGFGSFSRKI